LYYANALKVFFCLNHRIKIYTTIFSFWYGYCFYIDDERNNKTLKEDQMKKGFSLIELMVVVVIIGILAAIAIPNFIRLKDRAKESEVKANAHTIQLVAEDYATLEDGMYPGTLASVVAGYPDAIPSTMKNPFDGTVAAYMDGAGPAEGQVGYEHEAAQSAEPYTIRGAGKNANFIITLWPGM
jgi:prepilin-type N-terminal cleavage/methylation domain-containing protein